MKRDMDLCRKILFKIEEGCRFPFFNDIEIEGYDNRNVGYHCKLLYQSGLILDYKEDLDLSGNSNFLIGDLSWEGHEFIEKIRQDTIWNKTKNTIVNNSLPMTFNVVKDVATAAISSIVVTAIKSM